MNRSKFLMLAGAVMMLALAVSPILAQETAAPPARQDPAAQSTQSTMSDIATSQTFTGKIAKADGKYVLRDSKSNATYALDNQTRAKEFEGQTVKVTGKLDNSTKIIAVTAIEPGS